MPRALFAAFGFRVLRLLALSCKAERSQPNGVCVGGQPLGRVFLHGPRRVARPFPSCGHHVDGCAVLKRGDLGRPPRSLLFPIKRKPRSWWTRYGAPTTRFATTSVVKALWPFPPLRLGGAQIFSGRLAGLAIRNDVERDLLSLIEGAHARAFDCADVNEDILVAASLVRRLNLI